MTSTGHDVVGLFDEYADTIVRARGRLYDFHQLVGGADALLGEAADALAAAGHDELAARVREQLVGRNVVPGMWTYELVGAFDRTYLATSQALVEEVRTVLAGGQRHRHEAAMKRQRRTDGPRDDLGPDRAR